MSKHNHRIIKQANEDALQFITRRHFINDCITGMGGMALGSFLSGCNWLGSKDAAGAAFNSANPLMPRAPQFAAKAKSVIYLHMAGAPSQLELFDYKPELMKLDGQDCPQSLLEGKRFAFIRGVPKMLGPRQNSNNVVKAVHGYRIIFRILQLLLMK